MKNLIIIIFLSLSIVPIYAYGHNDYPTEIQKFHKNHRRSHKQYSKFIQIKTFDCVAIIYGEVGGAYGMTMAIKKIYFKNFKNSPLFALFEGYGDKKEYLKVVESPLGCRSGNSGGK